MCCMCFSSQRCRTNSQAATLLGSVRDGHIHMARKKYHLPLISPSPLKLCLNSTMALLNLPFKTKQIWVLHPSLLGLIFPYSWRYLFILLIYTSKTLFRLQSKFLLFCRKWRTVFHFTTMVGADALHFGGLHSSANFICLKQSRDQALHTLLLMEVMASWC